MDDSEEEETVKKSNFFVNATKSLMGVRNNANVQNKKTQELEESKQRTDAVNSLNQTKFEKILLNFNLVIIVLISLALFIIFSLPSEYSVFKLL